MDQNKLKYEDLPLGIKARDAFLAGKSFDYIKDHCPIYLNTRDDVDAEECTFKSQNLKYKSKDED